jgi:hypothetical protein
LAMDLVSPAGVVFDAFCCHGDILV